MILEALACGTPVVASDDLIRRWLVGDGGLTCDVSDARRFAAALQAAQAEGPALRARARAQAERCGWKDVAAGFAALADDLRAGRAVAASYGLSGDEAPFLSLDAGFQAPARGPREPGMEARA